MLTGSRQQCHQVLACPNCQDNVFVLPISPLPSVQGSEAAAAPTVERGFWHPPLRAAVITVALLSVMGMVILVVWLPNRAAAPKQQPKAPPNIDGTLASAREALGRGYYQTASAELNAVWRHVEDNPATVSVAERRTLAALRSQANLLADLLRESLEQILGHAAGLREAEWEANFQRHYRGKGVLFLASVRRDAQGQYHISYRPFVGSEEARLELADLRLLRLLPLDDPQMLLFGARLASARREAGGQWVIRFEPDSGVLITNPEAATSCCLQPLDEKLQEILQRQQHWQEELAP